MPLFSPLPALFLGVGVAGALVVVVAGGVGLATRCLSAVGPTVVEPRALAGPVVAGATGVLVGIATISVAGVAIALGKEN